MDMISSISSIFITKLIVADNLIFGLVCIIVPIIRYPFTDHKYKSCLCKDQERYGVAYLAIVTTRQYLKQLPLQVFWPPKTISVTVLQ